MKPAIILLVLAWMGTVAAVGNQVAVDDRAAEREAMVATQIERREIDNRAVLDAMRTVPRHLFVPMKHRDQAHVDHALPIGLGQTISQPYIVAFMTQAASPDSEDIVLEVGTGSGYQAAVLAQIVKQVYSIEIFQQHSDDAGERFRDLGYSNITHKAGDGYYGWEEHAPFDAIVVTAAAEHIPPPLVRQLKPGGVMVIPVGNRFQVQTLVMVEKDLEGKAKTRNLLPVRFVPLLGEH